MPSLILGLVVLVAALWAMNAYSKADRKVVMRVLRPAGGVVALGAAAFIGLRGHLETAIPLGLAGLGLLGWGPFASSGLIQRTQKSAGQRSRVRSAFLDMELDHDSGAMSGTVIAGRFQGHALGDLDRAALLHLMAEIDGDSRSLLAAYLDRREPGWRDHAQGDTGAGLGSSRSKMTDEEAYQILGLQPGAAAEDIRRAHRSLMKKVHPDQGGSTYLAAKINEAKERLLSRHR